MQGLSTFLTCVFLALSVYADPSCKYSIVGAGVGGCYYAYRVISQGLVPAADICIFELQPFRVGGRQYSVSPGGIWEDLTFDAAAYRIQLGQDLMLNLAENINNATTVCWNGDCGYRVYADQYGNNAGYNHNEKLLLPQLYALGMPPVFMGYQLVNYVSSGNPARPIHLQFLVNNATNFEIDTAQLLLNVPGASINHINTINPTNLLVTNAPTANFQAVSNTMDLPATKEYIWYDDAWWLTKLNKTSGTQSFQSPGGIDPPAFSVRYLDGAVKCQFPNGSYSSAPVPGGRGGAACRGSFAVVYAFSTRSATATNWAIKWENNNTNDSVSMINAGSGAPNEPLLTQNHAKLMTLFNTSLTNAGYPPSTIAPPRSMGLSHWNATHRWYTPSYYQLVNSTGQFNPDTDWSQRNLVNCPIPGFDVFIANEAWSNIDGWAEGSLWLVERLLARRWGLGVPAGVDPAYYTSTVIPNLATGPCGAQPVYQWAYPLWHMASLRYLTAVNTLGFTMNKLYIRGLFPSTCDPSNCGGTPGSQNPAPVVSPDTDTYEASAWLDLQRPFVLSLPNLGFLGPRYYSVQILDMYTNTVASFSSATYPNGGSFCLLPAGSTTGCSGVATQPIPNLPRYGQLIIKQAGYLLTDNFFFLQAASLLETGGFPFPATLDPKATYNGFMSGANGCRYVYNQPICGSAAPTNPQFNNFWGAVCEALAENPLAAGSDEANYVNTYFGNLGITAVNCTTLNYPALNAGLSAGNPVSGYTQVTNGIKTSSWVKGPWVYQEYNGNWGTNFYDRVQTSTRLQGMNANADVVYYTAFTDSSNHALDGTGASYKITFASGVPIDTSKKGFWSLTVYDNTFYLVNPGLLNFGETSYQSTSNTATSEIHFSPTCGLLSTHPCLNVPSGPFNIVLRGYIPQSSFLFEGTYPLPTITKCGNALACN